MMLRKVKVVILALALILSVSGCGGENAEEKKEREIAGLLPTRIEQIDQGGVIPEGYEAKVQAQSEYTLDMLWGTWVRKGSSTEEMAASKQTVSIGSEEEPKEIGYFPENMKFNPAWAGTGILLGSTDQNGRFTKTTTSEEPMAYAFENFGYGFGVAEFNEVLNEEEFSFSGFSDEFLVTYAINENVLAVGITEKGKYDEAINSTNIVEIDYEMSLKGYELQLTYQGETVVYVPESIEGTTNYQGFYIEEAGITDHYEEIDHIRAVHIIPDAEYLQTNSGPSGIMTNIHEGYVEASYDFGDDGTVKITSSKGDSYEYEYYYSGDSLTLMSEEETAVYSLYNYVNESKNETPVYGFYAAGTPIKVQSFWSVADWIEKGFSTTVDLDQPIASCQVTDEIELSYQGAKMTIKAVNPYENVIALADCMIGYYCMKDTSGVITREDNTKIGVTTYDEVDFLYAPYEKSNDTLRYKGRPLGLALISGFDSAYGNPSTGAKVLDQDFNMEVIYNFEDDVLTDVTMENPALLYNGLQDNVGHNILAQLEPAEFQGILQIRDTIMDRLRAAFAEAGIQVQINEKTGEILMDNDILFAVDKYDLTSAGQQYIDSFMGVYASVITAEEFSDYISGVYFEGHTDSSGSYGYNLTLSQKRADTVLDYCVNSTGSGLNSAQKEKMQQLSTAIGYSSSDLIYDDRGNEDMDASRRVAIKFFINVDGAGTNLPAGQDHTVMHQETTTEIPQDETSATEENTEAQESETTSNPDLELYFSLLGDSSMILMPETTKVPFVWLLPMEVQMFLAEGWTTAIGAEETVEPGFYNFILEKDGGNICITVENSSSSAIPFGECKVMAIEVTNDDGIYVGLKGGIDFDSTEDEIMNVYGTPDFTHTEEGFTFLSYGRDSGTVHFAEGPQDGIFLLAPGYSFSEDNVFYTNLQENNSQ